MLHISLRTHTHTHIFIERWRRSCHARPWPAHQEQFWVRCLAQGHFNMLSGGEKLGINHDGWSSGIRAWAAVVPTPDSGDAEYNCRMDSVKTVEDFFFPHAFVFVPGIVVIHKLKKTHSLWCRLTHGALPRGGWHVLKELLVATSLQYFE